MCSTWPSGKALARCVEGLEIDSGSNLFLIASNYHVYVVVQFYPWFNFYFPLFLGMVMHDTEFETKENKN